MSDARRSTGGHRAIRCALIALALVAIGRTTSAAQMPAARPQPALQFPSGITLDSAGNVFVADRAAHVVFRIDARTNEITVVAGTGTPGRSGDGGPARAALLSSPEWVEFDARGNLYVADRGNHVIRRIDPAGIITHVAGTGVQAQSGDGGPAATAAMTNPFGFTLDRAGNLFFFDTEVHTIRRIDARTGIVTTVIGTKQRGFSGDGGPGMQAMLFRPHNGVFDRDGSLIFGDSFNNRIRRWDPSTGIIQTIAGSGEQGSSPDGTPALQAKFTFFGGMAVDRHGDLIVTGLDHRIFKVDMRAGVIRSVAGTGVAGFSGEGSSARTAQFASPYGIVIAPNGDIVFADAGNARVRRIDAATGVIRTIAGPGSWKVSAICASGSRLASGAAPTGRARAGGSLPRGHYAVGFASTIARDDTRLCRTSAAAMSESQGVSLGIDYWYPATGGAASAPAVTDTPAARGAFPIVVGMRSAAPSVELAEHLASHGYVVALVRPTIEYDLGAAQRVEAFARDIGFAASELGRLPFADTARVATWGAGGSAAAALIAAVRTRGVDAAVSIDGTMFDVRESTALAETPLRDAGSLRVPLLHVTHASANSASTDVAPFEALRYSARLRLTLADTTIAPRRATAEYVRRFLDAHLRQDATAAAWLARAPEQNGVAPGAATVARYAARPPAPTAPQFVTAARGEAAAAAMARFNELRRADPEADLFQEATINGMGYQLLAANRALALELFRTNSELFPRSTNTWDSMSEAYETAGDTARAVELARKAFDVAPTDTTLTPVRRAEFQRIATERIQRLRAGSPPPQRP